MKLQGATALWAGSEIELQTGTPEPLHPPTRPLLDMQTQLSLRKQHCRFWGVSQQITVIETMYKMPTMYQGHRVDALLPNECHCALRLRSIVLSGPCYR